MNSIMNHIVNNTEGRNIVNDIVNDKKGHNIVNDSFAHKPDGLLVKHVEVASHIKKRAVGLLGII